MSCTDDAYKLGRYNERVDAVASLRRLAEGWRLAGKRAAAKTASELANWLAAGRHVGEISGPERKQGER